MPPSRATACLLLRRTARAYLLYAIAVLLLAPFALDLALSLVFYPSLAFGIVAHIHSHHWFGAQLAPSRRELRRALRQLQARRKRNPGACRAPGFVQSIHAAVSRLRQYTLRK